ncbi:hypothetical protein HHI36_021468, partial [Cryptolaemus montrouzieri]
IFNEPSRITLTTESCIDVFSNMDEALYTSRTFDSHLSDHQMQELKLRVPRTENRDNIVEKYIINETNTRRFENLLNDSDRKDVISSNAEESFEKFHDTLYTIFNPAFPWKSIRSTRIRQDHDECLDICETFKEAINAAQSIYRVRRSEASFEHA